MSASATVDDRKVLFIIEGRPVFRGDQLYVVPSEFWRAGLKVTAELEGNGMEATCRTDNGAVPTLLFTSLSWTPHPEALDREAMSRQGIFRPTMRDLQMWRLGRDAAVQNQKTDWD